MKKNLNYLLSALGLSAAAVFTLSGCRDYDVMDEEKAQEVSKQQEFYDNFVKEFGQPDPNHTWGWGMTPEMADAILATSTKTRADGDYTQGGRVNVNRNQWCNPGDAYSLLNVYGVPGWPNWDGKYYTAEGTYENGHYTIYDESSKPAQGCNMPSDVTEFEILWVANAVHYKNYSETMQLHISDYFIQEISTDADYENDADYKAGNVFFYGKTETRPAGYNNYKMDKLDAKSLGGTNTWTHINNFNASMNWQPRLNVGHNSDRNIIYVQSAGTEKFRYHPSNSDDSKVFEKLILVEFTWDEPLDPEWSTKMGSHTLDEVLATPSLLGETKQRSGYYLCFDFQDSKAEYGQYDGDGIYDNWILKLTPGYPIQKNRWPKRLMCEDLGNTYDFDFNDAVFDLSFAQNVVNSNAYDMIVVIQAAGGTMPIQVALPIGWTGGNAEIHNLLGGNDSTTPVNVIKGGAKSAPAMYRMKNVFTFDHSTLGKINTGKKDENGKDILVPNYNSSENLLAQMAACAFKMEIHVNNGNNWESVSGYSLYQGLRNNFNDGEKGSNFVPQLFNCSTDAKWTYENGHINDAYKHFKDWVKEEQGDYRLRWDERQFFYRNEEGQQPTLQNHDQSKIDSWKGSWDYGVKSATSWGLSSEYIDKSKCWGGNGPE